MFDLLLLSCSLFAPHTELLIALSLEGVEITSVVFELRVGEMDDLIRHIVQELFGMGDHYDCEINRCYVVLEPDNRIQVEMVSRLIQ